MPPVPDPIPDILAELRAGRFGYDFVRVLVGDGTNAWTRRGTLDLLLGLQPDKVTPDVALEALTNLLIIGGRHMLDELNNGPGGQPVETADLLDRVRRLAGARSDVERDGIAGAGQGRLRDVLSHHINSD